MHVEPFTHDAYTKACTEEHEDFMEVFQHRQNQVHVEEHDTRLTIISNMGCSTIWTSFVFLKVKYCNFLEMLTPPKLWENSVLGRQFPTYKGMDIGPECKPDVAWFISGCILFHTNKSSSRKKILYHPLSVPTRASNRTSMDFIGGFPRTMNMTIYLW
jgi:hypothetical protein